MTATTQGVVPRRATASRVDVSRPGLLQVVLSLDPGGTERLVIEMSKHLESSYRPVVCCLDGEGVWAAELTSQGIPVVALRRRAGFHPSLGFQVRAIAVKHRIQVLHCHHYSPFVYGLVAAMTCPGIGLVFTEHGRLSDDRPSPKRRFVNPFFGRFPGRFFAVSESLREHMLAEGFPPHRVSVVYNGIQAGRAPSASDRYTAREHLRIPDDALVIGTVARFDPVKDLTSLVDAFAKVRAECSPAVLVLFGDGTDRAALEERVGRYDLQNSIRFLGQRADVRALLPALDVYVNSSISEGVSLTILEAMAASLPVIATRVGGTPEVVIDEQTGLLVPARVPDVLATSMIRLLQNQEQRCGFGRAGRFRVEREFGFDRMIQAYTRAYRAVGVV